MGATGSISEIIPENGKIYKKIKCGCIFNVKYINHCVNDDVNLCLPCYHCIEDIKKFSYDHCQIRRLLEQIKNFSIEKLIGDHDWLTELQAEDYAKINKINFYELANNTNVSLYKN